MGYPIYSTSNINLDTQRDDAGKYPRNNFYGACIDTSASKSVCWRNQAIAYWTQAGHSLQHKPSTRSYPFGNHVYHSEGVIPIRIPININTHVTIYADLVAADVPFLIVLSNLKKHHLLLDYLNNVLIHQPSGTKLLVRIIAVIYFYNGTTLTFTLHMRSYYDFTYTSYINLG